MVRLYTGNDDSAQGEKGFDILDYSRSLQSFDVLANSVVYGDFESNFKKIVEQLSNLLP